MNHKRQRASDDDLRWKGQTGVRRHGGAELGHVPVGANRKQEVEQERDRDEAQRLDDPQSPKAADERQDRAAKVDDHRDRRPQADRSERRPPTAPAAARIRANRCVESRRSRTPRRRLRSAPRNRGARLAPSARAQGRQRLRSPRRSVAAAQPPHKWRAREARSRRATQALAGERAKGRAKAGVVSMLSALPIQARVFLADCTLSRKPAFSVACRSPHSGPIWRLCALDAAIIRPQCRAKRPRGKLHDHSSMGRIRARGRRRRSDRRRRRRSCPLSGASATSRKRPNTSRRAMSPALPGVLASERRLRQVQRLCFVPVRRRPTEVAFIAQSCR